MKRKILLILFISSLFCMSLQEAYENAGPYENFDKYLILEPNTIYTGGVGIYEGSVYINCQGSIIDLEQGNGVWVYSDEDYPSSLDIEYCTIINGLYYGISYGGDSEGNIVNCNLINTNFGLKLFDYSNVNVTNSIFSSNETYGIGVYTQNPSIEVSYCLFWENVESDCMENCPGWGNIWTQLELDDNAEIIYANPEFQNEEEWSFTLNESSPCIDSGNPNLPLDNDGTTSDIGSIPYNSQFCSNLGDVNNDNVINVLDVVEMINCILFSENCTICFDINEDNEYNILDILVIINIIINY